MEAFATRLHFWRQKVEKGNSGEVEGRGWLITVNFQTDAMVYFQVLEPCWSIVRIGQARCLFLVRHIVYAHVPIGIPPRVVLNVCLQFTKLASAHGGNGTAPSPINCFWKPHK